MIRSLIRKEWKEHWFSMLFLGLLMGLGFGVVVWTSLREGRHANALSAFRLYVGIFGVLAAIVLSRCLVAKEYLGQTQLFLETLPFSRASMVTVKWTLGWTAFSLWVALALAVSLWLSRWTMPMEIPFISLIAARTYAAMLFVYSFFFILAFLGRYRTLVFVVIGFALCWAISKSWEIHRFGPFALLNETFATERHEWPVADLVTTLAWSAMFILGGYLLALVREGAIAGMLAEKMSHREKVFLSMSVMVLLGVLAVFEESHAKKPFDLPNAMVTRGDGVMVKVASGSKENTDEIRKLGNEIHTELKELKNYLGMQETPGVFITIRRDLDPHHFELGEVQRAEGVVVRANLNENWRFDFLPWLVREWLVHATQSRAKLEERRWVLDGFGYYWAARSQKLLPEESRKLMLRALYGVRRGFEHQDLRQWLKFREEVGDEIACGVAWSGLETLRSTRGEPSCRELCQALFGRHTPRDVRAVVERWKNPIQALFQFRTSLSYDEFVRGWQRELAQIRPEFDSDLKKIPEITAQWQIVASSEATRRISYEVRIRPAPPEGKRYIIYYKELPALDEEVSVSELRHESQKYGDPAKGELSENYRRGTRLFATSAYDVENLGCPVISGWVRQEVP